MANQFLNSYEFEWNPDRWTIPKPEKFSAHVLTYQSVGYFSFGLSIVGKEIILEWDWMTLDQWNELDMIYQSDAGCVWVPGDGNFYNVEILNFDGAYFEVVALDIAYRRNVKLLLMILSVGSGS